MSDELGAPGVPPDLVERARAQGADVSPTQAQTLARFLDLLLEANRQFNLTAVRSHEEAWSRHVLDSLSLASHLDLPEGGQVVDVGAGGGLPGLPLAIVKPELQFTLIDATEKKARYLERTIASLGLPNARAVHGRAEELAGVYPGAEGSHRERYDVAVTRALAPLPVLLELVSPLVKPGGRVIAIKGQRAPEELAAAQKAMTLLHLDLEGSERTPTGTVLTLIKRRVTPQRFPRRPGEPKRAPL